MSESTGPRHARHGSARAGRLGVPVPAVRAVQGLAAVLALTVLVGFGYGWYNYRTLDSGIQRLHLSNLAPAAPAPAPSGTGAGPTRHAVHGTVQNILLVGIDSRKGMTAAQQQLLHTGGAESMSTDTMMILHIPADGSAATMISLPRDSYVDIPGYKKNKLNAAYADGYAYTSGSDKQRTAAGADLLLRTVRQLTGVPITHYVQVGFVGFYKIAKVLGTIPVTLCHAVDDSFARNRAAGLQGGSDFVMSAGKHDLNPVQALEFVRQRHFLHGGDLAREKRQRYFIAAAFNKITSMGVLLNPGRLHDLIKAVTGSFYMDDNDGYSITDLASQLINLTANDISGQTIPTEGSPTIPGVGSVELVDPAKVKAAVQAMIDHTPRAGASSSTPARAPKASTTRATQPPDRALAGCVD